MFLLPVLLLGLVAVLGWISGLFLLIQVMFGRGRTGRLTRWFWVWLCGWGLFTASFGLRYLFIRIPMDEISVPGTTLTLTAIYGGPVLWLVALALYRREQKQKTEISAEAQANADDHVWPPPPSAPHE